MALGRAPWAEEVSAASGLSHEGVAAGWRRLHDAHALVLDDTLQLRMLNPFSAVETVHRVHAAGGLWYANCAWDAFGICSALHRAGTIETVCADCGEPIEVDSASDAAGPGGGSALLFHTLVPAREWWDEIGFT